MPQKISTSLYLGLVGLAIGVASFLSCQSTWARSYSFTDVAANLAKTEAKMAEECDHDRSCEENYYERISRTSFLGLATYTLNQQMIFITSANHTTHQIRYFYNDHIPQHQDRDTTEDQQHYKLKTLWLLATSNIIGQQPHNQELDTSQITPQTEIPLQMEGLEPHESHLEPYITYWLETTNGLTTSNGFDYSDCTSHPDYRPGQECRLYFTDTNPNKYAYLPTEPGKELVFDEEPEIIPDDENPSGVPQPDICAFSRTPDGNCANDGNDFASAPSSPESNLGPTIPAAGNQTPQIGQVNQSNSIDRPNPTNQTNFALAHLPLAPNTGYATQPTDYVSASRDMNFRSTANLPNSRLSALLTFTIFLMFLNVLLFLPVFLKIAKKSRKTVDNCGKVR